MFGEGVRWKTITPLEELVFDPTLITEYHAPTVGPEEVSVVKNSNFGETFDRPPFIGIYKVYIIDRFKRKEDIPKDRKSYSGDNGINKRWTHTIIPL